MTRFFRLDHTLIHTNSAHRTAVVETFNSGQITFNSFVTHLVRNKVCALEMDSICCIAANVGGVLSGFTGFHSS